MIESVCKSVNKINSGNALETQDQLYILSTYPSMSMTRISEPKKNWFGFFAFSMYVCVDWCAVVEETLLDAPKIEIC